MTPDQKQKIARLIDQAIADIFKRPTPPTPAPPIPKIFTTPTAKTKPHQIVYSFEIKPGRRLPPVSIECFDFAPHRFEPLRVSFSFDRQTNIDDVARILEYYAVALSFNGAPLQQLPLYVADEINTGHTTRARSVIIGVTANTAAATNHKPRTLRRSEQGRGAKLTITLSGAIHHETKTNRRPRKSEGEEKETEPRPQTAEPVDPPARVD